jgi:transposase
MPAPTPLPLRLVLARRVRQGQSVARIAQALDLSPRTVRRLRRRALQQPADALAADYAACGRRRSADTEALREEVLALRRTHPRWGAGLLRVLLQRDDPDRAVPCVRTLQRWLHGAGLGPAPSGRRPASETPAERAKQPHAVWQMDAAEQIRLQNGQRVSWLRLVDECSGAVLWTKVFAQGKWLKVPPQDVQAELRRAFARWGRPLTLRVDNGGPWGSAGDLPPDLALWLIGLGIDLHWNDAHAPRQNGIVERSQGLGKRWAEVEQCRSAHELQQHLQTVDAIQREAYPACQGQTRAAAFPKLAHSGRRYSRFWERQHWDHARVLQHLAGYAVVRKVDQNGDVSLYHRPHYVGILHRAKRVYVMLDPQRVEWLFADDKGQQLRVQPAEELQAARIQRLTVTNRR